MNLAMKIGLVLLAMLSTIAFTVLIAIKIGLIPEVPVPNAMYIGIWIAGVLLLWGMIKELIT